MKPGIEVKKDYYRQQQEGITKIGFTFQHGDIPDFLSADPLGKRYYMVLVDADYYENQNGTPNNQNQEMDLPGAQKIVKHAVLLCKNAIFQEFLGESVPSTLRLDEAQARNMICNICEISSRSELSNNIKAQNLFSKLVADFDCWKLAKQYSDNLSRY